MEAPKRYDYDFNDPFDSAAYTNKLRNYSEYQQKEIEQLNHKLRRVLDTAKLNVVDWNKCEEENEKLKEEIRMLKQYAEIAKNDKKHRKGLLNKALEEIKQLKTK